MAKVAVAYWQFGALRDANATSKTSADAAISAANTAQASLDDSRLQFTQTLQQMEVQTQAAKEAATAAQLSATSAQRQAAAALAANEQARTAFMIGLRARLSLSRYRQVAGHRRPPGDSVSAE